MNEAEVEVPTVIKEKHVYGWWAFALLLLALGVLDVLAGDVLFGALFVFFMAALVFYMVANRCQNMTQACVLMLGLTCTIQATFELVTLLLIVGGRTSRHRTAETAASEGGSRKTQTITITEETHPFFDPSQGV